LTAPRFVLVLSDWHCGHRLGLMPPDVQLYHEDENGAPAVWSPKPTQYQAYLWDLLDRQLSEVAAYVKKRRVVLIINGDVTQGQKYPDLWVSTRLSDQIEIAQATADYILQRLPQIDTVRIAFGTPSHEFGEGSSARLLWKHIEAQHKRVDVKAVSHGIAEVEGVAFDYAHHGPGASQRVWLNGNQARYYLKDIVLSDILGGRVPPRVVLRSHVHTYLHEALEVATGAGYLPADIFVTPSWCGMGDHAIQVTRSASGITHGSLLFEVAGGAFQYHALIESKDVRHRETL